MPGVPPRRPRPLRRRAARPSDRGRAFPQTGASGRVTSSVKLGSPRAARPRVTARVLVLLLSKVLGLGVLLGSSGLLYDVASSPTFSVSRVSVEGDRLMASGELEAAASARS